METLAVILMSLGILVMAGHSLSLRWLVKDHGGKQIVSELQALTAQSGITFVLLLPLIFVWEKVANGWGAPIVSNRFWFWVGVTTTSLANVIIQYATAKAKKYGEIPLVAPVQALTPGLVSLTAAVLGEKLSPLAWLGVILVSGGIYIHARWEANAKTVREWLLPLAFWIWFIPQINLTPEEQNNRRALRWAYLSAIFGTLGLLGDGLASRHGNLALAFTVQAAFLAFVFGGWAALRQENLWQVNSRLVGGKINPVWIVFLLGSLFAAHVITVQTAFRLSPIAVIGTLKRVRILVEMPMARYFLGEKKAFGRRLLIAIVVCAGAVLLALDDKSQAVFNYLKR